MSKAVISLSMVVLVAAAMLARTASSGDGIEGRLTRLEQRLAALEEKVDDIGAMVAAAPSPRPTEADAAKARKEFDALRNPQNIVDAAPKGTEISTSLAHWRDMYSRALKGRGELDIAEKQYTGLSGTAREAAREELEGLRADFRVLISGCHEGENRYMEAVHLDAAMK